MTWKPDHLPDLRGHVAVVTGANSGIGWHTSMALASAGAHVVLACRDVRRGAQAVDRIRARVPDADVRAVRLDLASMASVRDFAAAWSGPLSLLINNAGVMAPPKPVRTEDGYELQFGTNHLGHFVLTGLLLPALLAADDARVVTISSIAHHSGAADVVDGNAGPGYLPRQAYANSKLANLLFAVELDRQAQARGLNVTSVAAHPGLSATGLFIDRQGMGASRLVRILGPVLMGAFTQSAKVGARPTLFAAVEAAPGSYTGPLRLGETRGAIGPARRSTLAQDAALARRLWQVSEDVSGFRWTWPGVPTV